MNWEDILKEDSKKLDAINKVLHTFMVDIDSNIEILGLMPVPVVKDGPELIEAKKEIPEIQERPANSL